MGSLSIAGLPSVEAQLNYLDYDGERPAYYLYEPVAGQGMSQPRPEKHAVRIYDVRRAASPPSLDDNGFAVVHLHTTVLDFFDGRAIRDVYYEECAALVKAATGAHVVQVFDHNVRDKTLAQAPSSGVRDPVRFVHNDYTETSGPQRVRDLMGNEAAAALLARRFVFINVWRPIRGPVLDVPLAVCDAHTLDAGDFIATDLRYADRTGEVYSVRHNPAHHWFYVSHMQADEVLLLKCYDAARDGRARYTAHSAFRDPGAPPDALSRQSIEVRTIAFFDEPLAPSQS